MDWQIKAEWPPLLSWLDHYWIVPVTIVFVAMVLKSYWPNQERELDRHASIPLDDDP